MNKPLNVNSLVTRGVKYLVLFYQGMAVLVFAFSLFFGIRWLNQPFPGGFFEHSMILNGSNTTVSGSQWGMYEQGYEFSNQLMTIDGKPVSSASELDNVLAGLEDGQTVPVLLVSKDGDLLPGSVPLERFPTADRFA